MIARKQNKSCDECRRSRIGCDARLKSGLPCSNCERRGKACSTDWLIRRRELRGRARSQKASPAQDDSPVLPSRVSTTPCQTEHREQALRLHHALWDIFTSLFEPRLGLWIGNECNPFKRLTTTLVSRLMVTLDAARSSLNADSSTVDTLRLPIDTSAREDDTGATEACINQALMSAVHAFSARWLPMSLFEDAGQRSEVGRRRLMQALWNQAHRDALLILTLPSYRSILALYLFAITPSLGPADSQMVSQLCYETSLRHYLHLRIKTRISTILPGTEREEFGHLEDSAYWFGLVCDISRSLLRCQPPVLICGPSSQARVWALVSHQVDDFAAYTTGNGPTTDLLSDAMVLKILQLGSSCKTMCWASVTDVQDSLFYNRTSLTPQAALKFCFSKLRQFETVFGPHMERIARDFILLNEKSQLGYRLADTLVDEGVAIADYRLGSVRAIVNTINLVQQFDNLNPHQTSLLLRDPYPEHASNAMARAAKSVVSLTRTEAITMAAASVLAGSIMQALQVVAHISFSASQALTDLPILLRENNIALPISITGGNNSAAAAAANATMSLDSAVTPEMLENETLRELGQQAASDPGLVLKTIERHETEAPGSTPDFGLDYLQFIDFSAVAEVWDFDDVFSGS
ncbi:hypothetical protein CORC01_13928 [Colletotrichum orchidophilum]|uniref:Zn(2)-C6 fungal-type domain-containing protein n=1 Tax=Colletotrichum orchidophilum TaxID=1209926 RepID=A0A1G4ANL9_9PEZI|nr:uncharacterized protein CORC01_13928 [Colletotrichum orchidophilum]OHE90788.1 hypothetical protein CORC01_13928 [Colletotrichum orchidophilum]